MTPRFSSRLLRVTAAGAGIVAVTTLGITAASAATTYKVAAGSAAAGTTVSATGTTTGSTPQVTFKDTTANLTLTCDSSSVPATAKVGSGLPAAGLASINGAGAKFTNCKGPFSLAFVVTGKSTWKINATGATSNGSTPGSISAISAHVADGTTCVFDVAGTVAGTYKNGTSSASSTITLPGTTAGLTISNVSGSTCGLAGIKNGDKASFTGAYAIKASTAAYNPVTVTSQ